MTTRVHYRPEIDGLRAIAVIAVMLYHARIPGFGGGFAGVDIFFVISGYLITGIIARDLEAGRFSLSNFWERRARRILPALLLVLGVTTVAALVILLPDALKGYSTSLAAASAFAANLYFWRLPGGYFGLTTDTMPLIHLWSLAVEEQFYLLFPLMLLLLWRAKSVRVLRIGVAVTGLVSLGLCVVASQIAPAANFYLLPMRAWELLAGATIALAPIRPRISWKSDLLAAAGFATAFVPLLWLTDANAFPWPWALPVVAGTALVIAFATPSRGLGRVLASTPFVAVGLISYSAYLWHQPLLALAREAALNALTMPQRFALLAVSLALAAATWRWIERPLRSARFPREKLIWPAGAAIGIFLMIGLSGHLTRGFPARLSAEDNRLAAMEAEAAETLLKCMSNGAATKLPEKPCLMGRAGPVRVALIGDSHASSMAPGLAAALEQRGERGVDLTAAGCPPIFRPDAMTEVQAACRSYAPAAARRILADPGIDTVVMAARWTYHVTRTWQDNGEGGVETGPYAEPATAAEAARFAAALDEAVSLFLRAGRRVVLIYPVPEPGWAGPRYLVKQRLYPGKRRIPSVSAAQVAARSAPADAMLDALGERPGLARVRPASRLCDTMIPGRCALFEGREPLYFDDDHLSPLGARIALADLPAALNRPRPHSPPDRAHAP